MFEKPFVVLPTYNEIANIERMVTALFAVGVKNLSILVVDDSSPDGTAEVVQQLQKKNSNLFLLIREKKEGLGRAYAAGFAKALELGGDAIIQMDADFSHDPLDIIRLLSALDNADLVIGSRYCCGGKTVNWPWHRWCLSYGANIYARLVTRVSVADLTGGFKAWRADLMCALDWKKIRGNGYGFQIEATFYAHKAGFHIQEIPIIFSERRLGQSKMNRAIIVEALGLVWKLRQR